MTPDPAAVADAVLAHPSVLRLDGGPFGVVASHLPGRRLPGVRIGAGDEPTEVAVVVALGRPFPALADEIAGRVRSVLGPVPVDVTFSDVGAAPVEPQVPPAPTGPSALA
ncbi:hypothetical protein [Pseudonocardia endophytica]|uniref:Uncharacterized protein n=1 Tax=Pseudonocardia endophytica TaxID=401976 RepID=A0A4R1HJF0_PSEEN|nr:hypothetical protein [Pseudonocardia endophytica]TCK21023.1 hypothetical protein EV378_4997 [Pseudonocardia endophytica]